VRALSDNGLFGSNGVLNLGHRLGGIARHLLLFSLGQGPINEIKNIDTRSEESSKTSVASEIWDLRVIREHAGGRWLPDAASRV
jgi:hypothetical protein